MGGVENVDSNQRERQQCLQARHELHGPENSGLPAPEQIFQPSEQCNHCSDDQLPRGRQRDKQTLEQYLKYELAAHETK